MNLYPRVILFNAKFSSNVLKRLKQDIRRNYMNCGAAGGNCVLLQNNARVENRLVFFHSLLAGFSFLRLQSSSLK